VAVVLAVVALTVICAGVTDHREDQGDGYYRADLAKAFHQHRLLLFKGCIFELLSINLVIRHRGAGVSEIRKKISLDTPDKQET
jgi:hypothetical protein